MICRWRNCTLEAMPGLPYCGRHDEAMEDQAERIRAASAARATAQQEKRRAAIQAIPQRRKEQRARLQTIIHASVQASQARRRPRCIALNAQHYQCARAASYGPFCYWHRNMEVPHA